MTIQQINLGAKANDGTGDSLRTSFKKCNDNFNYLNNVFTGNGIISANSLTITGNVILGDTLTFTPAGAAMQYGGNANAYVQMVMQNKNPLSNASTDFVATADNGNDSSHFIDMGIASSSYYYAGYESILPNDGYLIVNGGHLLLNAGSVGKNIKFVVGGSGTANIVGNISSTSVSFTQTTASTNTSTGALVVTGGAGIGGSVYSGGDVVATNGSYAVGTYGGSFSDGIVTDYVSGTGRFSVGSNDGFSFYNGSTVAAQTLLTISNNGNVSITANTPTTSTTTGALVVTGGAGISGNLITGSNLAVIKDTFLYGNVTMQSGNATINSPYHITVSNVSVANVKSITYNVYNLLGSNSIAITANLTSGYSSRAVLDVNADVTITYNSITSGAEKLYLIRNVKGSGTANIILPNSNNNKGTNVVAISAGTVASVYMLAADTTSANVMVTIVNN